MRPELKEAKEKRKKIEKIMKKLPPVNKGCGVWNISSINELDGNENEKIYIAEFSKSDPLSTILSVRIIHEVNKEIRQYEDFLLDETNPNWGTKSIFKLGEWVRTIIGSKKLLSEFLQWFSSNLENYIEY